MHVMLRNDARVYATSTSDDNSPQCFIDICTFKTCCANNFIVLVIIDLDFVIQNGHGETDFRIPRRVS
ncbi:unnamed protein product [Pieris brassicae]|uniref:Uncharacterized protein n=1 Tax=Pieris brassicae TaxID=7116 RepID=A0A9P0TEH0_PIEBR|nr:unnamed protein product [Pieris brassicae]